MSKIKEIQAGIDMNLSVLVFQNFSSGDDISASLMQRKCKCGYFSASRVLRSLIKNGIVQKGATESSICKVL